MLLAVLQTWVGGKQTDGAVEPGGGWGWTDGSPLGWDNWADGQPDNNEWQGDTASCLFMQESGLWYDGICSKENEFLCEKPPTWTGAESLTGGPLHCAPLHCIDNTLQSVRLGGPSTIRPATATTPSSPAGRGRSFCAARPGPNWLLCQDMTPTGPSCSPWGWGARWRCGWAGCASPGRGSWRTGGPGSRTTRTLAGHTGCPDRAQTSWSRTTELRRAAVHRPEPSGNWLRGTIIMKISSRANSQYETCFVAG